MKSAITLLVSFGLFIGVPLLHAASDATKDDTATSQGASGQESTKPAPTVQQNKSKPSAKDSDDKDTEHDCN